MARPGRHRQFLIAATLVMASVATTLVTALVIGGLGRTGQTANTTPSPAATRDGSPSTTPSPLSTPSSSPSFTVAPEVVLNPALISTQRHADVSLLIDGGGAAHIVTTLATPDGYDGSAGIV